MSLAQHMWEHTSVPAGLINSVRALERVLKECADYLDCIPESAAGGDDEARRLVREARAVLAGPQP